MTSQASHLVGTIQDLLYIAMTITCVSYLYLVISRSSLFSGTKQNKAHRESTVNLHSSNKGELPRFTSSASRPNHINMGIHTYIDIYVSNDYDQTTCYIRIFKFQVNLKDLLHMKNLHLGYFSFRQPLGYITSE